MHQRFVIRESFFIFFLGLFLFTIGLSHQEMISFESRFYLFSLEMMRHGITAFPTTYGKYYPDYPVTSTLLIYLSAHWFGGLTKWTAVFPSVVASALTLVFTYRIGALHGRRWGWSSVLFLLCTLTFFSEARTISLDQYTTLVTTISFYLAYSALLEKRNPNLFFIALCLLAGFAFRGPIGLIIPASVLFIFYATEKNKKHFFVFCGLAFFLLLFCIAVLSWLAYHAGGSCFLHNVLRMQIFSRMNPVQTPPFYFYVVESMGAYAVTYPLAIIILIFLRRPLLKKDPSVDFILLKKIVFWILIVLIGLSIPADKKVRYLLPIAPALALISGYFILMVREKYVKKSLFILSGLVFIFVMSMLWVVEPINIKLNSVRGTVLKIESLRQINQAKLIFYQEDSDGLPIKYLINISKEEIPLFVKTPKEILLVRKPAFFISSEENFNAIPNKIRSHVKVVFRGEIVRKRMVVFSKK